jgi:hypothetical protein
MKERYVSKQDITKSIKILDVAGEFGIKMEPASSGNFDYKCTCPSLEHKNGHERTSSCYIDSRNNNFHCFGCLPPDAEVLTPNGLVEIKDLNINDKVYTALGNIGTVTAHFKKNVNEKIYKFILSNATSSPLAFTEEHKMLVVRDIDKKLPYIWKHSKTKNIVFSSQAKNRGTPVFYKFKLSYEVIKAKDISPGDYFFKPCISPDLNLTKVCNPYIKKYTRGPNNKRITSIPINKEMMWLFGVYCAEGSLYREGICFTLNIKETEYLNKIKNILEKNFNVRATIGFVKDKNVGYVTCSSTDLNAFFKNTFKRGCKNKTAPYYFARLPIILQESFLCGVMDGDGSADKRSLTITSKKLSLLLQQIAVNLGRPYSFRIKKSHCGNDKIIRLETYTIRFYKRNTVKCFFEEVNGVRCFLQKIESIEINKPLDVVYDITVNSEIASNTFLCRDYAVHNCNVGSNVIDFYMLCAEVDFSTAMKNLKPKAKQGSGGQRKYASEVSNFPMLIKISALFRKTMLRHPKDLKWINQLMKDSDIHILNIDSADTNTAKKLYDYIDGLIKKRYQYK